MERHQNATTETLRVDGLAAVDGPAPPFVETDRLRLERAAPGHVDVDRLHELFGDLADPGEVFAQCGWTRHHDAGETRTYLDRRVDDWERGERYEYVLAVDDEYAGATCIEVDDDGACELGYWARKPFWGRGLAGEAAEALVHVAIQCLESPFVVVGCLASNDASRRTIERFVRRFGGAYVGSPPTVSSGGADDRDAGGGEPAVVPHHEWVVTRTRFESGERGISTLLPGVAYDDVSF